MENMGNERSMSRVKLLSRLHQFYAIKVLLLYHIQLAIAFYIDTDLTHKKNKTIKHLCIDLVISYIKGINCVKRL